MKLLPATLHLLHCALGLSIQSFEFEKQSNFITGIQLSDNYASISIRTSVIQIDFQSISNQSPNSYSTISTGNLIYNHLSVFFEYFQLINYKQVKLPSLHPHLPHCALGSLSIQSFESTESSNLHRNSVSDNYASISIRTSPFKQIFSQSRINLQQLQNHFHWELPDLQPSFQFF